MDKIFHIEKNYMFEPLRYGQHYLYQVGRLYCGPDMEIAAHTHLNWFELTIVNDGVGFVYANQKSVPVKKGDIFLSFPCDEHRIVSSSQNPLHYDFCSFNTDCELLKKDLENIMTCFAPAKYRLFQNDNIRELVSNAIAEINFEQTYNEMAMENILALILICIVRNFNFTERKKIFNDVSRHEMLCYQIMNYIDTHIYTLVNLDDLKQIFNYTYSYLSDLFKKTTASSIHDYYLTKKLNTARSLLMEKKLTVTQIASLLNYSSVYSFSRAFKTYYKVSPKFYSE